ncbi:hypothetical protein EX895_005344 [Sporisorium graminicola]|uniref:Protein Zds1 C-terminal domain-containing protein n=1 Tax=Sporisorium graminicola TaxID=280036 RepID=A0A4U7KNQ3_9BASI|nr:hypothetical protein EX895_005344 [Sporisorium graminicola]TKY85803.1 hypothetical protein EX895_005344 [Sporisorium graminicola]
MSGGPMRITDDELAREVEALKSHRRLSVNRPVLDPDLPDLAASYGGGQELLSIPSPERERRGYSLVDDGAVPIRTSSSSASSANSSYTNERATFTARRRGQGSSDRSSGSEPLSASPTRLSPVTASPTSDNFDTARALATSPTSISSSGSQSPKDPSHLFWVPASVHPEISPSDFRNFIKEHAARAVIQHAGADDAEAHDDDTLPPLVVGDSPIAHRLNSVRRQQQEQQHDPNDARGALLGRATSLSRRGSTLRRQYRPEQDTEDSEDDRPPRPLQRNRSGLSRGAYGLAIPNLTIDDLQKLEAAAEQASQSQDPAMLRSVLRRTLSLNTTPDLDTIDAMPAEPIEDPDAPIIVPKPGQILRRAARTKMRKASGDSTRGSLASRRRAPRSSTDDVSSAPSEGSRAWELQHSSTEDMERRHSGHSELSSNADDDSSAGDSSSRPVSTEATDSIVDAYSRDSYQSDASQRTSLTSAVDSTGSEASALGGTVARTSSSPSPPHTPTQESATSLASTQPGLDGGDGTPVASQKAAPRFVDPLETPRPDGYTAGSNQIKPIAVSHLPPVPAFEKTLPQQHQQKQAPRPPLAGTSQPSYTSTQDLQRRDGHAVQRPQIAPIVTSSQQPQQAQAQRQSHAPPPPVSSPPPSQKHKEKERKGAFGLSWFGLGKDDDDDRVKVEKETQRKREKHEKRERKEREREEKEREESSSSSFLGALFGKKKGNDEASAQTGPRPHNSQLTAGSLLERNEMGMSGKGGAYFYSRYPIHIERAVYRLSHIKLANPRRPLYEQVLISNLMFWYLSIINRSSQGQYGGTQPQQPGQEQQSHSNSNAQISEQSGHNASGLASASAGPNGYASASPSHVETASAYDGMDTSSSSPDSEDLSSTEQWNQNSGASAATKQKRNGLVKPNRAPAGAHRGRAAETPMRQPGYGMQHRQIDDDLKTMGSHAGQVGGSTGFVVGQVVDVKALQANTPYRLVPDPRSADGSSHQDQAKSATTDYLGLGNQLEYSDPLWPGSSSSEEEMGRSTHKPAARPASLGTDGTQQQADDYRRGQGHAENLSIERKHSSSPSRPYRSEAEKERAWLGMRNSNSSGRASPTHGSHGYGSISQQQQSTMDADGHEHRDTERSGVESHPQGRSMSVGGIGAMNRTGDWGSKSTSSSSLSYRPADRSRKVSMGHLSPSSSSQGLVSSSTSTSSASSFGTIDENGSGGRAGTGTGTGTGAGKVHGGMSSSSSPSALDYGGKGSSGGLGAGANGQEIHFPMAPGSSAMLEAARTSQSRRR